MNTLCGITYKKGETKAVLGWGDLFCDNKMTKFVPGSEKIVQEACCGDQLSPGGGITSHWQ